MRGGLYSAGGGAKGCASDHGFAADEPGIRVFGAGWLGDSGAEIVNEGNVWVRAGVCGDFAGSDSGRDAAKGRQGERDFLMG